jgi:hypothetical protein
VVDEWLIRKNSLCNPGYYPYPLRMDPISCNAIALAARPAPSPYPPQYVPAPMPALIDPSPTTPISITIINANPEVGAIINFAIGGVSYQAAGGSRQDLSVLPDSNITYDSGGSLGQRRYRISPGRYEFRSTPEGWALYKLPYMP